MILIFVHGWGFDRTVWHRVVDGFDDHACGHVELGFTGKPPVTDIPANAVVIGHSLGVMWALRHAPGTIRGLVSIGGFDSFAAHIPGREMRAMQRNLRSDPDKQMKSFYAACGYLPYYNINTMNLMRLDEGLQWLGEWDERSMLSHLKCPVMALGAEDDLIVPSSMTHAIWDKYNLRMAEKGGHVLPLTRHDWCKAHIREFIDAL